MFDTGKYTPTSSIPYKENFTTTPSLTFQK
jgi:hypothetical protein